MVKGMKKLRVIISKEDAAHVLPSLSLTHLLVFTPNITV